MLDLHLTIGEEVGEAELARRAKLLGYVLCLRRVEKHALLGEIAAEPMAELIDALKRGQIRSAPDLEDPSG